MLGAAIAVALVVALVFWGRRVLLRRTLARLMSSLPGAQPSLALSVTSFSEIDDVMRARACPCGGGYRICGEGTRVYGDRRLRVVHAECARCEREVQVYFDVTEQFH